MDSGSTLFFAGNAKEDESKADNLFISFEKMSIKFEEKTGSEKSKKKRDHLPKQTIPFNKKFKLNVQALQPETVQLETK